MKRSLLLTGLLLAAAPLAFAQTTAPATRESPAVVLERGIYQEETAGNLEAAANVYRQIIDESLAARSITAEALSRLTLVEQRRRQYAEAAAAMAQLKKEYPEQKEWIAKTEKQFIALRVAMTDQELQTLVDQVVNKISVMASNDPKLPDTLELLRDADASRAVPRLATWLDTAKNEERRAAIYVLWMGPLADVRAAVPELEKALGHSEDITRGMAALALGGRKVASAYDKLVDMSLNDASPYARRCAAYALGLLGKQDARETLEKAAKDNDQAVAANARAALKMLDMDKGKFTTPQGQAARQPTREDKQQAEALAIEAWKLRSSGNLEEAETTFEKVVALDPTSANAWNGLGWSQINQNKIEAARQSFEKAVALDPKSAAAWNGLGWIAKQQGQTEEAVKNWKKAVAAMPGATAAVSGLAQIAMEQQDYAEAVKWYEQWVKAEPNNAEAKAGLEKARQGR